MCELILIVNLCFGRRTSLRLVDLQASRGLLVDLPAVYQGHWFSTWGFRNMHLVVFCIIRQTSLFRICFSDSGFVHFTTWEADCIIMFCSLWYGEFIWLPGLLHSLAALFFFFLVVWILLLCYNCCVISLDLPSFIQALNWLAALLKIGVHELIKCQEKFS